MPQPVRVLLAVSSPFTLKSIERLLAQVPQGEIEIVGVVQRGREVADMVGKTQPNLLCIDDAPPTTNALEVTGEVMRTHPCPILVLVSATESDRRGALKEAGALDCWNRPDAVTAADATNAKQLVAHLKLLSRVPVIGRRASCQIPPTAPASATYPTKPAQPSVTSTPPRLIDVFPTTSASASPSAPPTIDKSAERIVAMGASTGGPLVLMKILSALPANFPYPIVCVQHVSQGFLEGLVSWLDGGCRVRVAIAQSGEKAGPGTVLFPPENRHMEISPNGLVRFTDVPPRDGHRPSVTVLFESVARSYGPRSTAVLLTGMGADGASGLSAVRSAGGDTIAQDEASCVVFGMPRVAIESGGARHIADPDEIVRRLLMLCEPAR